MTAGAGFVRQWCDWQARRGRNEMDASESPSGMAAALAERYGPAVPPAGPWNETIAGLLVHRSVRGYRPDPLPDGTLETLVAAAQSAATSSNLQTWSVVAVTDPAKKAKLAEWAANQKHIVECPLYLVWLADLSRLHRTGEAEGRTLEGLSYLEMFLMAAVDASLAAQNATVAAESLGLSSVYIGAMRNHPEKVAALLDLPQMTFAVFGMCVGHAADTAAGAVKPRFQQPVVLHRERYDASTEATARAGFDETIAGYSRRHEMAQATWTERALARVGTIAALSGRDRLVEALRNLGFPLK